MARSRQFISIIFVLLITISGCSLDQNPVAPITYKASNMQLVFSFSVASDMRQFTGSNPAYFRGVCEAITDLGMSDFLISPGDCDPLQSTFDTIKQYLGADQLWYPAVGNHDAESPIDMQWLRNYNANGNSLPNIVNSGPFGSQETTYSFDVQNVHIVMLNQYFDKFNDVGTDGDVSDPLYYWLIEDLSNNTKPITVVIGHEPAYPQPDKDNGILRHSQDSLNLHQANRDRFCQALKDFNVLAYISGHNHGFSQVKINDIWHINAGHAMGAGEPATRSTFLMIHIAHDNKVLVDTYRFMDEQSQYELRYSQLLN